MKNKTRTIMIAGAVLAAAALLFPAEAMAARRRERPAPRQHRPDRDGRYFWPRFGLGLARLILQGQPAGRYVTVYENVLVEPGHHEWRKQRVLIEAAHYEVRRLPAVEEILYDSHGNPHRIVVRPGRTERVLVPARYEVRRTKVWIPPRYEVRAVKRWVSFR